MARCSYDFGDLDSGLQFMGREAVRRIVMAGAEACVHATRDNIQQYRHIVSGSMQEGVRPGKYHEDLGSGWVEVYPQGDDGRGISNAKKAFVINYGYGKRKTRKTGDKFITGNKKKYETSVAKAMQDESDRVVAQLFNT